MILWKESWDLKKLIHPPSLDSLGRLSFIGDRKLAEDVGTAKTHPYSPFCMLNEYLKFSNICHKNSNKTIYVNIFEVIFKKLHMLLLPSFHSLSLNSFLSYPFCCFLFLFFLDMISADQIHTKKCMFFCNIEHFQDWIPEPNTLSIIWAKKWLNVLFYYLLCLYKLGEFLLSI